MSQKEQRIIIRRNTQGELIAMKKQILDKFIARQINRNQAAELLQMHPNAISRLKKKYLKYGKQALIPQKPGPKNFRPKNRTPEWIEDIVVSLAVKWPNLGPQP